MAQFQEALVRDTVLVVGAPRLETFDALDLYEKEYGKKIKIIVIADKAKLKTLERIHKLKKSRKFRLIECNFKSVKELKKCLDPIASSLLAVTVQFEGVVQDFQKLIPHVPYLQTPTSESLDWATDKLKMRRMLTAYDPRISPKYSVVTDPSDESISKIESKVGYPLFLKPAGLAGSRLVYACYHEDELRSALKKVFKRLETVYKDRLGNGTPRVLVEKLMEGSMYSIDAYVNYRGNVYFLPPVHVKTGRSIGFDDYFGYQQLTPTKLKKSSIDDANDVCQKAIKALGMRSTTCHIELIKTVKGWKIVEVGPRQGGFRHRLYELSYGINHILNDILIRIPQKPIITRKRRGFSAAMKIYAKKEGNLKSVQGIAKVRALNSLVEVTQNRKLGDKVRFAHSGGGSVFDIILFNKDRSKLLADIRRIEKNLVIKVESTRKSK